MTTIYRTIRLIYRASRTPWGQDILAFIAMLFALASMITLLTFTCVALHGAEACYN